MSSSVYAYIVNISDAFYSLLKTQFVTVSLQSGKLFSIFFFSSWMRISWQEILLVFCYPEMFCFCLYCSRIFSLDVILFVDSSFLLAFKEVETLYSDHHCFCCSVVSDKLFFSGWFQGCLCVLVLDIEAAWLWCVPVLFSCIYLVRCSLNFWICQFLSTKFRKILAIISS